MALGAIPPLRPEKWTRKDVRCSCCAIPTATAAWRLSCSDNCSDYPLPNPDSRQHCASARHSTTMQREPGRNRNRSLSIEASDGEDAGEQTIPAGSTTVHLRHLSHAKSEVPTHAQTILSRRAV